MSGLTSATSSRIIHYMDGGIPPCLFNLTHLESFHASGNGLNGSIADLHPTSKMLELSLSHNQLTGSIPLSIQQHNFTLLELDHNKFRGEFRPNPSIVAKSGSSIRINFNRLSGLLSSQFMNYENAEVLVGNIWYCDDELLPPTDPNIADYDCSTYLYYQSIIVWGVIVGFMGLCLAIYIWAYRQSQAQIVILDHDPNDKSIQVLNTPRPR